MSEETGSPEPIVEPPAPAEPPPAAEPAPVTDDLNVAPANQPAVVVPTNTAVEWLTLRSALRTARAKTAAEIDHRALASGRLAQELAERALDPAEPFKNGSAAHLAIGLHRQAIALAATAVLRHPVAKGDVRSELGAERLHRVGLDEAALATGWDTIENGDAQADVALDPGVAVERAEVTREIADRTLSLANDPSSEVARLALLRLFRLGGALIVVVALIAAGAMGLGRALKGKNLAAGKPWHTSSTYANFHPAQHECDGISTNIFFHTNEEDNPWWDVDLGAPTSFSHIDIENRTDCCSERAVPLVVEVSDDNKTWREIGRRKETFTSWSLAAAARARYVRLRVAKKSYFHLQSVVVR